MLTVLSSRITSASPGQLALTAGLAVLFAALGYRTSTRYRALRGVTPWRLPSIAWALVCLVLQFVGLAIEILAELTTRAPYSPAAPTGRQAAGPPASRYAPPSTPPVAIEPPSAGELPAVLVQGPAGISSGRTTGAATTRGERFAPPAPDEQGRSALFGWYPDPSRRHDRRYFDGRCWSEHVLDGDRLGRDPIS